MQIQKFSINGYQVFANEKPKRGTIIYIKNDLNCTQLVNFATTDKELDIVWIEMLLQGNDKLLIGCAYRSPNNSLEEDGYLYKEVTEACRRSYSHILIASDFNHPEVEWKTCTTLQSMYHKSSRFLECISDCFLYQHVKEPTHHRGSQQANILDLVFTNEEDTIKFIQIKSPLRKSHNSGLSITFNWYHLRGSVISSKP